MYRHLFALLNFSSLQNVVYLSWYLVIFMQSFHIVHLQWFEDNRGEKKRVRAKATGNVQIPTVSIIRPNSNPILNILFQYRPNYVVLDLL